MLNLSHKKLKVWKKSVLLVKNLYQLTNQFPEEEKYGITSQLRRASVSVVSNISEGAARISRKEKQRFYEVARSSLVEIDAQVEVSIELGFITTDQITTIAQPANEIFAMLSKLIKG